MKPLAALAALVLLAASARAGDGRIEIGQATALAGAVTGSLAEDPAGFPVRITQPGSYRLTSDLVVPDVAAGGIVIAPGVVDVSIDLGGFTIRGPSGAVSGPPAWSCTGAGTGMGIRALPSTSPPTARNVAVRNGRVVGFGNTGIDLAGDGSRIEAVRAERNCGVGIALGDHAQVEASHAAGNLWSGILCGVACRVAACTADSNGELGIRPLSDSILSDVSTRYNGGDQIRGFESTLVADAVAFGSEDATIRLERGSLVVGVSVYAPVSANLLFGNALGGVAQGVLNGGGSEDLDGQTLDCLLYNAVLTCPGSPP